LGKMCRGEKVGSSSDIGGRRVRWKKRLLKTKWAGGNAGDWRGQKRPLAALGRNLRKKRDGVEKTSDVAIKPDIGDKRQNESAPEHQTGN